MKIGDVVAVLAWVLVAVLLVTAVNAMAQTLELDRARKQVQNPGLYTKCDGMAVVYMDAAQMRDEDVPPQTAFNTLRSEENGNFGDEFVKKAVNNVYFDSRFTYAGGQALAHQILDICMGVGYTPVA